MPPDNQTTTQNQDSEKNSIPPRPQELMEPALENTGISEPVKALPEVLESSPSDSLMKSKDIPLPDSTLIEPKKTQEIPLKPTEPQADPVSNETSQTQNEPIPEPIFEPIQVSEPVQAIEPPESILDPFLYTRILLAKSYILGAKSAN